MSAWFGFCLMEKLVLMRLVNCLLTAKKLFNQSRLHNSMSESNYVTQWKFLKRCSAGHWSYSHRRNEMSAIYVPLVIGWRRGVWRRCWGQEVNSPPPMTSVWPLIHSHHCALCIELTTAVDSWMTDWVTGSDSVNYQTLIYKHQPASVYVQGPHNSISAQCTSDLSILAHDATA